MTTFYQRHLERRANSRLADRLQRQSVRRVLAVGTILSALLIAWSFTIFQGRIWILLLASIPFDIFAILLTMSLRGIFELSDDQLDEYQIAERNRAYKMAYGVTLIFIVVLATAATALDLTRTQTFAVAVFAFLVSAFEPRLMMAWFMEDQDGDE